MEREARELAMSGREESRAGCWDGWMFLRVRERREEEDSRTAWFRAAEVAKEPRVRVWRWNEGTRLAGTFSANVALILRVVRSASGKKDQISTA